MSARCDSADTRTVISRLYSKICRQRVRVADLDSVTSEKWATNYYQQERLRRKGQQWRTLLHPSVFGACLAVFGLTVVGPIVLLLLFTATNYLSPDATFLITSDNSFFAFTERDLSMAGGHRLFGDL
ncbi:hypothetical protein GN958_ATG07717 [Phytophthora infestans]|uniref:Transmembrane protein n=1 Tax=Phytophthora infestans TaxID=4787 RepID=A0A8S9UQC9_PHYIN|nr:hypothetical protein GN958_ATG16211 [Phytophthora infestans]KAF4143096.1 hypothetical protein GN958_ATG07717 [Phytophthora infestans]